MGTEDNKVTLMGLTMNAPDYWDWNGPITVQGRLYDEEGWSVGATGIGHIWHLTCTKHETIDGKLVIHRHPVHDGIIFPGYAAMQDYRLKNGLSRIWKERS